ncbi:MAG: hypothetical protein LBK82_13140, partial [Planctomycetaceae bacterium]|nr:hypothetical protein [Planctomycetaceae bacterium]
MNRIISFIDGWVSYIGERLNPIAVLELRRQFNVAKKGTNFAITYGIFGLIFTYALLLPNNRLNQLINFLAEIDMSGWLAIFYLLFYCFVITFLPVSTVGFMYFLQRKDPLIFSALNDVDLYWGLYQIGLFRAVSSFGIFYFWIVSLYLLGLISFDIFAIFPVVSLISITVGNMFFSIRIIFKQRNSILFYSVLFYLVEVILMTPVFVGFNIKYHLLFSSIRSKDLNFINTWDWLPIVIVAFPIYFYLTLKVINFNLTSKKS